MFGLGMSELLIIFAVLLLFFGGSRIVGIAKGLGSSLREFKKALKDADPADEIKK